LHKTEKSDFETSLKGARKSGAGIRGNVCQRDRNMEKIPKKIMYNPAKARQSTPRLLNTPIMSLQSPPPRMTVSVRNEASGSPMRNRNRTSLPTLPPRLRPKARQITTIRKAKAAKLGETYPCKTRAIIHTTAVTITNISQV